MDDLVEEEEVEHDFFLATLVASIRTGPGTCDRHSTQGPGDGCLG